MTSGTTATALFRGSAPRTHEASGLVAKLTVAVLGTDSHLAPAIARITLGLAILPHGAQKLLGWFGGYGFTGTMHWFTDTMHLPWILGFAAIMAETIGGIALLLGFTSRVAALGVGAVFATAVATVHGQHGFFINWFGSQKGEGWEYFLLGLALVAVVVIYGGGAGSVDRLLGAASADRNKPDRLLPGKNARRNPSPLGNTTNSIRSTKSTYVAAFLLGGLIALLIAAPARSSETFCLDRIAIVQFSPTTDNRLLVRNGVLDAAGQVAWGGSLTIARPAGVPAWILNRNLINVNAWLAFRSLGGLATVYFELQEGSERVLVGDQAYMAVAAREGATIATGKVINISTRAKLIAGDLVIAGFVIEDRPRAVLVRAIGPGLAQFNVPLAHPDPWLTIKQNGQAIVGNDDWSNQADAAMVEQISARVGAFPLPRGSFDAAQVVILPPGAYTVHVGTERSDVASGEIMVEVYSIPEDVFGSE